MGFFGIQAKSQITSNTVVGITQAGQTKVDDLEVTGQEGDILTTVAEHSGVMKIADISSTLHFPLQFIKRTVKTYIHCGYLKVMSQSGN